MLEREIAGSYGKWRDRGLLKKWTKANKLRCKQTFNRARTFSAEMCFLSDNIYDYYNVSQGKITIPGIDDHEEMALTDVSLISLEKYLVFSRPLSRPPKYVLYDSLIFLYTPWNPQTVITCILAKKSSWSLVVFVILQVRIVVEDLYFELLDLLYLTNSYLYVHGLQLLFKSQFLHW